ncbi:MAG TPA: hypothetical protein VI612_03975 [Candidatus Nanoarchaeia archaeon]|nr:hypothetical protein [Candidatus Nanoarchaeia archaeon]
MLKAAVAKEFEQLKRKLTGKTGQQVLTVSQGERCPQMCHGFGGCSTTFPPYIETTLNLGIITAELADDPEKVTIPTEKRAEKGPYYEPKWELKEGPINVSWDLANLGKILERRHHPDTSHRFKHGFNIYTGEEVAEYFRRDGNTTEEYESAERWNRRIKPDMSYAQALRLLGQPVPDEFKTRQELEEEKRPEIERIINALVRENDFEANLRKAFELGLHRTPRTGTLRRGITVDIPEYILGLCERYKIEVPK